MVLIDVLLFDLDGTLIDSKKDLATSVNNLQKKYGCPVSSEDEVGRFIGDGIGSLVERAIGSRPQAELEEAVNFLKAEYRQHALDTTRAYPGVVDTLEHFRLKKMAVVTNKPERISKYILEKLELARYFGTVIGGDSVAEKKPSPLGIYKAIQDLGAAPKDSILIIGDGHQDVQAGRAAGIKTCGIFSNLADPNLMKQSKPDYTINSLSDLMRIIN